jgi:hypothetical protein
MPTLAFQAMGGPSFGQASDHPFSVEMPLCFGPRQFGQSSARMIYGLCMKQRPVHSPSVLPAACR